jgi:hypothetical protein
MSARPVSDNKKTEMPNFRMTKGELAMLTMKASIEGVSMSELVRRAVEIYQTTPQPETCIDCGKPMFPYEHEKKIPLEIYDKEQTLVITGVPAMKCECGEITYDLDTACDIEELVDILVRDALRYNKVIPKSMTIVELFREEHLGKNKGGDC